MALWFNGLLFGVIVNIISKLRIIFIVITSFKTKSCKFVKIVMGLLLCSIEFSTKIYWNRRLAAGDLFHKFTQSISSRSSHLEVFCRKGILTNSAKFTGKHLFQSLLFNKVAGLGPATLLKKRLWHRCFPANFAKFLRTPFFTEHLRWLPLKFCCTILIPLSYVKSTVVWKTWFIT